MGGCLFCRGSLWNTSLLWADYLHLMLSLHNVKFAFNCSIWVWSWNISWSQWIRWHWSLVHLLKAAGNKYRELFKPSKLSWGHGRVCLATRCRKRILSVFWAAKKIGLLYAVQQSAVVQIKWPESVIIVISPNLLLVPDIEYILWWWDNNIWPSLAYRDPLYCYISQGAVVDWVTFKAF